MIDLNLQIQILKESEKKGSTYETIANKLSCETQKVKETLNNKGIFIWDYKQEMPVIIQNKIFDMRVYEELKPLDISKKTGYPPSKVNPFLTMLEIM